MESESSAAERGAPSAKPAPPIPSAPQTRGVSAWRGSIAVLTLLFLAVGIGVAGVRKVSGGEVGVVVNNLTHEVRLEPVVGLHFTMPYLTSFYVLDRTTKSLEMLSLPPVPPGGTRPPDDSLNVKSSEGDNVRIDAKLTYRIIAERAVEVLRTTGSQALLANGIERNWIRPAVRDALMDRFNELTREEMNEGLKRAEKAELVRRDVNAKLEERFGIEILNVTVENPSSYAQYEQIVRQRKDTDQEVKAIVEQQSTERESQKKQETERRANAEKEISAARANASRLVSEARSRAQKTILEAEAEALRVMSEADGKKFEELARAAGIRAQGEADAEGVRQLVLALAGPQGAHLVAAEFAKRLQQMEIVATPFIYSGIVQPYILEQGSGKIPSPGMPPAPRSSAIPTAGGNR